MRHKIVQWATGSMGKTCLRDIIDHPALELVGLYVYSDKKARFEVTKSIGFSHKDLGDQLRNNMIVIGNIYENPELLEVVKL